MKAKLIATVLLLPLALAGCEKMAEYERQAIERQRQADIQRCIDFGYPYQSKEHADCMLQLYSERKEDERRAQEQYNTERTLQEMREKNCQTTKKRIPHPDGSFEIVERTRCN